MGHYYIFLIDKEQFIIILQFYKNIRKVYIKIIFIES